MKGQTAKSSYPSANPPSLSLIHPRRRLKPDLSEPEIFRDCFATFFKTLCPSAEDRSPIEIVLIPPDFTRHLSLVTRNYFSL